MFVSEGCIVGSCSVRVNISNLEGVCVRLVVDVDLCVDALKIDAVSQLYDSSECSKLSLYYNLLHVRTGRLISGELTLRQVQVEDDDDILLVRRRLPLPSVPSQKKDDCQPTVDDVERATADLPLMHSQLHHPETAVTTDFQADLRNILISLVDVAQTLVCLSSDDLDEAKKYTYGKNTLPVHEKTSLVDEKALDQLVEMGFDRRKATKALLVNRMSHVRAIQWLCDNVDDECDNNVDDDGDDDDDGSVPGKLSPTAAVTSASSAPHAANSPDSDGIQREIVELSKLPAGVKVQRMLTAFKQYKRRVFKPDAGALQSLLEMGFSESLVVDALRMFNNSKDEACDWLLNHDMDSSLASEDQLTGEGLDTSSTIYKAIMSSDIVRLSLSSHKTLTALLHILENPNSLQQWLRDTDMNPLLVQISRIYHAEKYGQ